MDKKVMNEHKDVKEVSDNINYQQSDFSQNKAKP